MKSLGGCGMSTGAHCGGIHCRAAPPWLKSPGSRTWRSYSNDPACPLTVSVCLGREVNSCNIWQWIIRPSNLFSTSVLFLDLFFSQLLRLKPFFMESIWLKLLLNACWVIFVFVFVFVFVSVNRPTGVCVTGVWLHDKDRTDNQTDL